MGEKEDREISFERSKDRVPKRSNDWGPRINAHAVAGPTGVRQAMWCVFGVTKEGILNRSIRHICPSHTQMEGKTLALLFLIH